MFPAHEPNTVMIANGLAGMGFAVPCGIAAKLVHPDRKVVTVNGDGGFLMNAQELETAKRLKTQFAARAAPGGFHEMYPDDVPPYFLNCLRDPPDIRLIAGPASRKCSG